MVTPNQLNEDRVSAHYKDVLELQNLCRFGNCRHLREPIVPSKKQCLRERCPPDAMKLMSNSYNKWIKSSLYDMNDQGA